MKIMKLSLALLLMFGLGSSISSQETPPVTTHSGTKIYPTSCFEFLFQGVNVAKTNSPSMEENMRFTIWFNYTQQLHFDFNDNVGMYTGLSVRNIGFITTNELVDSYTDTYKNTQPAQTLQTAKRRLYTLGVPLALKLGSFGKNFYVYGGGEMDLAVAYKEKRWINDVKSKKTSFFGSETPRFLPMVFGGIQMPGGLRIQYSMYLDDMLKTDYGKGTAYDQSQFTKSMVQYISLSFNFGSNNWKKFYSYTYEVVY